MTVGTIVLVFTALRIATAAAAQTDRISVAATFAAVPTHCLQLAARALTCLSRF